MSTHHDITTSTLDTITDYAISLEQDHDQDWLTVTVTSYGEGGPHAAAIEVTRPITDICEGCEQHLGPDRTGPVAWINERTGVDQGSWPHQHGCGTWNTPANVLIHVGLEDDPDEIIQRIDAAVEALAEQVNEAHVTIDAEVGAKVTDWLAEARKAVRAAGLDPTNLTPEEWAEVVSWDINAPLGGETNPGVYVDNGYGESHDKGPLVAWDYGHDAFGGTIIEASA